MSETPQKEASDGENPLIMGVQKNIVPEIPVQEEPLKDENPPEITSNNEKTLIIEPPKVIKPEFSTPENTEPQEKVPEESIPAEMPAEDTTEEKEKALSPQVEQPRRNHLKQYSAPRRKWTFSGKSLTVEEWAEEYGVGRSTMRYRLDTYHSPEVPVKGERIEYKGESHTVAEWAEIYGVTVATMRYRIAKWHKPELTEECAQATLTTAPLIEDTSDITIEEREGGKVIMKGGVEYTIWQFAKDHGIKFSTLRGRLLKSSDPKKVFAGLKYVGGRERRKSVVQGKIWVFEGEKHTVSEWAHICGTSKAMMRVRLNASGNPWQSDIKKSAYNERRTKKYQWEGEALTIKQLCERYSCSESAMRIRMKKHGSPEPPKGTLREEPNPVPEREDEPTVTEEVSVTQVREEVQTENPSCGFDEGMDGDENLLPSFAMEEELTAEEKKFLRPIKMTFPIDLGKYSGKGHSETFNAFVRDIRKIMHSPDDGMPLSRILGHWDFD